MRVFPGSERLRYLIPFGDVGETLREIERLTSRAVPYPAAIFADDGEKFGVWPGTHRSVYGEGWLRRFFGGIAERADWLTTMTFGEYVSVAPPRGNGLPAHLLLRRDGRVGLAAARRRAVRRPAP